jgi:hypothetical protein
MNEYRYRNLNVCYIDKSNFVMGVVRRENVGEFTGTIVRKLTTK